MLRSFLIIEKHWCNISSSDFNLFPSYELYKRTTAHEVFGPTKTLICRTASSSKVPENKGSSSDFHSIFSYKPDIQTYVLTSLRAVFQSFDITGHKATGSIWFCFIWWFIIPGLGIIIIFSLPYAWYMF